MVLSGVQLASRDWQNHGATNEWLVHKSQRLGAAEEILRGHFSAVLNESDYRYIGACRESERRSKIANRVVFAAVGLLTAIIALGIVGWTNRPYVEGLTHWAIDFWPFLLSTRQEEALRPGSIFRECKPQSDLCPEMIVVDSGQFEMGSDLDDPNRGDDEGQKRVVFIRKRLSISRSAITFDEWDSCARVGPCAKEVRDYGWGRGQQPAIGVSWNDAQMYVDWLSSETRQRYRLLREAEWEYVASRGLANSFDIAKFSGTGKANCIGCGSKWDSKRAAPVRSFAPDLLGLFDVRGNAWQWVEDCWHKEALTPDIKVSPEVDEECRRRVIRGGAWNYELRALRPSFRNAAPPLSRTSSIGFRVAREISTVN